MHVAKKSQQKFCSYSCQSEWQKIRDVPKRVERVTTTCDWCGTRLELTPAKVTPHNFCNKKCRREWYSNIFSQSPAWKEESRKRAVNILCEGKISKTNSSAQVIVNQILDKLKFNYINEYNCTYFSLDNYLPDFNLGIEVMGDFWHTNPFIYKEIKYKNQFNRIGRDKAKNTYITKKMNIPILYIWESDLNNREAFCGKLIKYYIDNYSQMKNFNSFNYSIKNNNIVLNTYITKPYFEQDVAEYRKLVKYA